MSWRLLKILGPVLIIAALFAHDRRLEHLRGQWQERTELMVRTTAETAGLAKLEHKKAPAVIRQIGADRDAYLKQRNAARLSLQDQTDRVIAMGEETARLRAEAARYVEQVRKLTAQRDGWIRKAQVAATRTERRTCEEEAREAEAAMDALYEAGF